MRRLQGESRRSFLKTTAFAFVSAPFVHGAERRGSEPIIDIHQHTHYSGRTDSQLIAHQEAMGVTQTVLLPAGRLYGLDAECGRNDTVVALSRKFPKRFVFFANEIPDIPEARDEITRYLRMGAIGIGEQKFRVPCDSEEFQAIAEIAQEFKVPILMHFWENDYNFGIERFHKTLEKFPKVNFIGHAQSWWGNIDAKHDQKIMYPTGKVTAGGISDRLLSDYPNMFGDLSAGSGLNALTRDEEHTRAFFVRHQEKLLFGSDCNDTIGRGKGCQGAQIIAAVRKLSASREIERKLLYANAKKLLKL
jgi:predicted TIM-barrel fold metal-dependent hydrolase